jgi:uncharacterized membrane protein YidH (DUF202 family)
LTGSTAGDPRASSLPAERTILAWTRTSFAFLVNGVLLTIKDWHGAAGAPRFIPAALAGAAALCSYVIALQRQRTLGQRPIPSRITPRRAVHITGSAVVLLIVVTTVAQLL